MNNSKQTYHAQKTRSILQVACRMIKNDQTLLDDLDAPNIDDRLGDLRARLRVEIPELADPAKCANCGASMVEYLDVLDVNDALLLVNMAKLVRRAQDKGLAFTDANKVRVSSADIHHTQKCRTTKCSKLGLIAKAGKARWSITTRGYEALRGDRVPKTRVTFRGQILERPEETTTLREVFYDHERKMEERQKGGKSMREDKRGEFRDYDPREWVQTAGYAQGKLL